MKYGDKVITKYGVGKLLFFREVDGYYVVDLQYGKMFATRETIQEVVTCQDPIGKRQATMMELNVAYEALEKMRGMNLEVACKERGIAIDHRRCTSCILSHHQGKNHSLTSWMMEHVRLHLTLPYDVSPCLLCASPTCSDHTSSTFRKEHVTVCLECEKLFSLDFVVDLLTATCPAVRRAAIDRLVNTYDRSVLLLKFSAQYISDLSRTLQASKEQQNIIGLGSSSVGLMSGALGVAAAATLFSTVGPPLLMASLFFGGSASVVQAGSEAINYFSEPIRLADRIISLHGLVLSMLRVVGTLRDALMRDYIRVDNYDPCIAEAIRPDEDDDTSTAQVLAGITVGGYSFTGIELSRLVTTAEISTANGQNARFVSRTTSNIVKGIKVARLAGGALSFATMILEAHCMSNTLNAIQAGNPCKKADTLRQILKDLDELPGTSDVERECDSYLETMKHRDKALTAEEATRLILEQRTDFVTETRQRAPVDCCKAEECIPLIESSR